MLLFFPLSVVASVAAAATVKLGNTSIIGADITVNSQDLEFFGGIPFAEPPVGNLRLKPPVLKTSIDDGTFNATEYGTSCLQVPPPGSTFPFPTSEECLSLNIWRPTALNSSNSIPVMVYIFGGGFIIEGPPHATGNILVSQSISRGTPIIYVGINYRIGPLGFPQGAEAASNGALNLGLKDQLSALQWIQDNIGAFGGDKHKVTVFGISAGSISISNHFLDPNFGQYVRAAILESGTASTTLTFDATRPNRQEAWNAFVSAIPECASSSQNDAFDCLRQGKIDPSVLTNAMITSITASNEMFPFVPTLDGPGGLFPELPSELVKKGSFARIPFMAGDVLDEGTLFTPFTIDEPGVKADLIANLSRLPAGDPVVNPAVDRILELYPDVPALGSPFNTGNETFGISPEFKQFAAIFGDIGFQFPRRWWTQTLTEAGVKAYGYLFTNTQMNLPETPMFGVMHGSETKCLFGMTAQGQPFTPTPAEAVFCEQLVDYWLSFVTSLDPNDGIGSDRPRWPQYTPQQQGLLDLGGDNISVIPDDFRDEQFKFVYSNPSTFRH